MFVVKIQNYKESLVRQLQLEICVLTKLSLKLGSLLRFPASGVSKSACVTFGPVVLAFSGNLIETHTTYIDRETAVLSVTPVILTLLTKTLKHSH